MNELTVIERENQRVMTTAVLAEEYGTTERRISENFSRNADRYIVGKHYYCLEGEDLQKFKSESANCVVAPNINKLYLWTEKGAFLHAKSLGTDRAWEVYDYLVDSYFKKKDDFLANLSPELRAIIAQDKRVTAVEKKIDSVNDDLQDFKRTMPLLAIDCHKITDAKNKKVVPLLGGKNSAAYKNASLRGKVYRDVEGQLRREFDVRSYILAVSIAFDDLGEEWATEMDITSYDAEGNEMETLSFTNDAAMFYAEIRQHSTAKLVLTIKAWNVGNRVCKISQIVPGYILSFASEGIFEFEFEERIDPFSSSLTLPEATVVFDNTDNEFNIINPDGMISFLRQKMKVVPKLDLIAGVRTDTVGMGNFYLYSFPKTDQPNEAKVSCRPAIAFETGNYVNDGRGLQTVEEAVAILFANVTEPVVIDDELKNIQVNQYIGDDIPIQTALGYLAIACCGYWKFERDGSYSLKKWKLPETMLDAVTYDNMWTKPSISMGEKYTSCTVKYYVWDAEKERLIGTDVTVTAEENDGVELGLSSYFICTEEQARQVARAYMDYKNLRLEHTASYRGDMSLEAADGVTIQNDFEESEVIIMRHALTFTTEGLTGTIVGRGLN